MSNRDQYYVVRHEDHWKIKHNASYIAAFKTQQEAMDGARLLAKEAHDKGRKSQVLVQGKDLQFHDGMELRRRPQGRQRISCLLRSLSLLLRKPGMYSVPPTDLDVRVANAISRNTNSEIEEIAQAMTWGADEHVLCLLAVGWWLYSRSSSRETRRASEHVLLCIAVTTVLPHILKGMFNQERPDRLTVRGHWRGVPISGRSQDAFPSGHAMHIGALTSAASILPSAVRNGAWLLGAVLVSTRVVLLAHWVSDVVAGFMVGLGIERVMRHVTGFGRPASNSKPETSRHLGKT